MENCTLKDASHAIYGKIKAANDPNFQNSAKDWNHALHEEKGASIALADKVAQSEGRKLPGRFAGIADVHNPLVGRLANKLNLNEGGNHSLFGFTTPEESVAPRVLEEVKGRWKDYKTYISPDADAAKTYKAQVSKHAEALLDDINQNPGAHGVNDTNRYPTIHMLELVRNGWPEFDFSAPDELLQADYGAKGVRGKLMQSRVILNPMIYLFHAAELPLRATSMYPNETAAVLGEISNNPGILKGEPIPEAVKAGVYTKLQPDMEEWGEKGSPEWRYQMGKALTGIPLCQTVSESVAWLLHKEGVPLDEALQNVALSHQDPFKQQFMVTRPDHSSMWGYVRYSMLQNAWYLNLAKRALGAEGSEAAQKAWTALGLYSAQKAVLFGSKAAIPLAGVLNIIPGFTQTANDIDDKSPLNLVKKATGMDLGDQMSPVQTWSVPFYPTKILLDTIAQNPKDFKSIQHAFSKGQDLKGGLTAAHLLLMDYNLAVAPFLKGAPVVPNEALKVIQAYAKSVDNASGNAASKSFGVNLIGAHLGKDAQKEFAEHAVAK